MVANAPTITEITNNIVIKIEAEIAASVPLLPKSFTRVIAKTLAGIFALVYKRVGFNALQTFIKFASDKPVTINGQTFTPLIEYGRQLGVGDPTPATQAEHTITITVENQVGTLPVNTQLVKNGITHVTLAAVNLNAASVTATIRAIGDSSGGSGAGAQGNLTVADTIGFVNPVPNVSRQAVVASQTVTGVDAEATASYRQRVLDREQKVPQGGAYADYELWAEAVPGIINAYPYTGDPGQTDVYCEATIASSGSADGIPTIAQLNEVLDYINDQNLTTGRASRRNTNSFVNALPITRTSFDVDVVGITGVSDLAQVESDIEDALAEYFLSIEPFIPGLTLPPRRDQITRTRVSAIVEDIVTAAGGTFTSASFYVTGTLAVSLSAYSMSEGEKAKNGMVNFS